MYNILLPEPQNDDEQKICDECVKSAPEYVKVTTYYPESQVEFRGINYTLHRYDNKKRHIIYSFEVGYNGKKTAYISSSFFDAENITDDGSFSGFEKIFIGSHGAKYKNALNLNEDILSRCEFANDEVKKSLMAE